LVIYTEIPIDSQYLAGQIGGNFPDVYRGGLPGEVYVSSYFPDKTYKVSFSADTGYTFRHVYVRNVYYESNWWPGFMSDREPGVFYGFTFYQMQDPCGDHAKICIEYYRDYGETLEATFCHDLTKDYEYKEVICEHTTNLNATVANTNSIQLQWVNAADNIRGYHVYRNNVRITNYELQKTTYLDEDLPNGNYEYYVRAYYKEGCVSDSSNHVRETITLDITDFKDSEAIILYPNPTTGELHVTCHSSLVTNIEVFDVYGRNILSHTAHHTPHTAIDISSLWAGIYFVRITTEYGVVMRKVVKW
jgi:hypothetical protein